MIKQAFEEGYMHGLVKTSAGGLGGLISSLGWSGLALGAGIPIVGGLTTGYLHGSLAKKDYGEEVKHLLGKRDIDLRKERNKKLKEEIRKLLKERNLTISDIGYKEL